MRVEVYGCFFVDIFLLIKFTIDGDVVVVIVKKDEKWLWGVYFGIVFVILFIVGVVVAVICWKRKSKVKKQEVEIDEALMGMYKCGDREYRVIEKNVVEFDEDDENVV